MIKNKVEKSEDIETDEMRRKRRSRMNLLRTRIKQKKTMMK